MGIYPGIGPLNDIQAGVTATGTNLATAYSLVNATTIFDVVAPGTGCELPVWSLNSSYTVFNRGSNSLLVYPQAADQVETLGAGNPSTCQVGYTRTYVADVGRVWRETVTNLSRSANTVKTTTFLKNTVTAWTKDPKTILVQFRAIGAGGPGGGGAMETLGTVGSGAGGGAPGDIKISQWMETALIPSPLNVTVGVAGTIGLGAIVNGPGTDAVVGGTAQIATTPPFIAYPGGGGGGGKTAAGSIGGSGPSDIAPGISASAGAVSGTIAAYNGGGGGNTSTGSVGPGNGNPGGGGSSVAAAFLGGAGVKNGAGGSGGTLLAASSTAGANGGASINANAGGTGGLNGGGLGGSPVLASDPTSTGTGGGGGGGGNTAGPGGAGGGAPAGGYGIAGGGGGAGITKGGDGGLGGDPVFVVIEILSA